MRGCFGGFWRRRVRLTGWRSGFRATGCRCAGRPRCMGWRVRTLSCRSICEGVGRGGGKPLFFFAGWVSAIFCAVCVLFPNTSAGLRTLPSPNAEPAPSLFIPSQNQYYNQRRESRQEKPLLSLTRFFCLLLSPPKRRKPK